MNKVIKVPFQTYVRTFCIVAAHVIVFALLSYFFIPEFQIKSIILFGVGFYVFKVINYVAWSVQIENHALVYNRFFKKGIQIPLKSIGEVELMGPSQFNSNYMLAFLGNRKSIHENRNVLGRLPIYWFSRGDIEELLNIIRKKNPAVQYEKRVNQYLSKENRNTLLVNYLIQYTILTGILIYIVMKYS